MMSHISLMVAIALALATLPGPPLPQADGKGAPDAREYVLTVEGITWAGWITKVREALQTLPCVEASTIKIDMEKKETRFGVKKGIKCDEDAVKKVLNVAGFTVTAVEAK